ncbi:MAG: 30S ribosomal protein S6 [Cytophagales bacterium]|nr:30S ribosomal protein S6 [Cytophagales bacterium]
MQRQYETIFILSPTLSKGEQGQMIEKVLSLLKEKKASIVAQEDWGLKKLAYPIQKKDTGVYHLIRFLAAPNILADLNIFYRRNSSFIRFNTVLMDKHAIAYHSRKKKEEKETSTSSTHEKPLVKSTEP